ncbi:MAG TPA: LD-carboxypeptidase [Candidatus Limnocylindrales bacterium]|nr:LD-carboxypeptidase [Candidatus Limnocylindrales bacterium]
MPSPLKPPALRPGDAIRIVSLATPVEESRLDAGCAELTRLGYAPKLDRSQVLARDGFFAGSASSRWLALKAALAEKDSAAIFCARGGYGSNYILDEFAPSAAASPRPKILLGYSDITSLQIFLWQKFRHVTFYGPMVASGFDHGPAAPKGYDRDSLMHALAEIQRGWTIDLRGEALNSGAAEGTLVGGCLTLVLATLGTPWELDTTDSILLLEDRDMKPYQVDRALMHLKQAGKLKSVRGIILGDFPGHEAPPGSETVRDVARRILLPLERGGSSPRPIVFGAAFGHTERPMLTIPLGVRARLTAAAAAPSGGRSRTQLEILEPAVA